MSFNPLDPNSVMQDFQKSMGVQNTPQSSFTNYDPTTLGEQQVTQDYINNSYDQLNKQYQSNTNNNILSPNFVLNDFKKKTGLGNTPDLSQQEYFAQQDANTIKGLQSNLTSNGVDMPETPKPSAGFLEKLGNRLSLLLYPTAGAINNALSDDPNKHWWQGVTEGLKSAFTDTKEGKVTYKDVLNTLLSSQDATKRSIGDDITNIGNLVNPWAWEDIAKQGGLTHDLAVKHHNFSGFIGDMLLDPMMYVGLGEVGKIAGGGSKLLDASKSGIGTLDTALEALNKLKPVGETATTKEAEALYNKTAKMLGYVPDSKGITFAGKTIPGLSAENIGRFADSSLGKVVGLPFDAANKIGTALKDSKIGQGVADYFQGGKYGELIRNAIANPESALSNVAFADYLKRTDSLRNMAMESIVKDAKGLQDQIGEHMDASRSAIENPDILLQKQVGTKEVDRINPDFQTQMEHVSTLFQSEHDDITREIAAIDKKAHGADPEAIQKVAELKKQQELIDHVPGLQSVEFEKQLANAGVGIDKGTSEKITMLSDVLYNPMVARTSTHEELTNIFKTLRDKGAINGTDEELSDLALRTKQASDNTIDSITKEYPNLAKFYSGSSIKNGEDVIKRGMSTPSKRELMIEKSKVSQQMKEAAVGNNTEELAKLQSRYDDLSNQIENGSQHMDYKLNTHSKNTEDIGYPELVKQKSVLAEKLKSVNPKNTKIIEKIKEDIKNIDKELSVRTPVEQLKMDTKIKKVASNSELSSRPLGESKLNMTYAKDRKEFGITTLPNTILKNELTKGEYETYLKTGNLNHLSKYIKNNLDRIKFHYDNLISKGFYKESIDKMSAGTIINKSKEFITPDLGKLLKDVPTPTGKNSLINEETYKVAVKEAKQITEKNINPYTGEAITSAKEYNIAKEMFSKKHSMSNMDNLNEFGNKITGEEKIKDAEWKKNFSDRNIQYVNNKSTQAKETYSYTYNKRGEITGTNKNTKNVDMLETDKFAKESVPFEELDKGVQTTIDRIIKLDPSYNRVGLTQMFNDFKDQGFNARNKMTDMMNGLMRGEIKPRDLSMTKVPENLAHDWKPVEPVEHDVLGYNGIDNKNEALINFRNSYKHDLTSGSGYGLDNLKDSLLQINKEFQLDFNDLNEMQDYFKLFGNWDKPKIQEAYNSLKDAIEKRLGEKAPEYVPAKKFGEGVNNVIDLASRKETPLTKATKKPETPLAKISNDREFLKFDTPNGVINADVNASSKVVNALGDNILNRPEELKNVNSNVDTTMLHGSIGKGEAGGELKGTFDNTTKKDITLSDRTTPNELTGTLNHETAHAFGNNEWHTNRTSASITRDMKTWTTEQIAQASDLFKRVGRTLGEGTNHITKYLDDLSKAGANKVTMNRETLAEFGSVFLHNDPLVRQEAQRLFPEGYNKMLNLVSKLPEKELKELVPKGSSMKDEILAKLDNMKEVVKVFENIGVTDFVKKKALEDRLGEIDNLLNNSKAYKNWFKENYKEYPEFLKVQEPVFKTTGMISAFQHLPEGPREALTFMRNKLIEAGIDEGIITNKMLEEQAYKYFPHVMNWDLKNELYKGKDLFGGKGLIEPTIGYAKGREVQGTIEKANQAMAKYIKEKTGKDIPNFFEENLVRAYSERMIAHENFMFKKDLVQKSLDLYGTEIGKAAYDKLATPGEKIAYHDKIQAMFDSGEYDVVRPNDKYEMVEKNVIPNEVLGKAKADKSPYNAYIKIDPKEVNIEKLLEVKDQPVYLIKRDTHKILNDVAGGQYKQMDNALLKMYDKFNNLWKSSALFSISFNFNNTIGNMFNSYLGVGARILDPKINYNSAMINLGKDGEYLGKTFKEWRKLAEEYGVLDNGFIHNDMKDLNDFRQGVTDNLSNKSPLQRLSLNPTNPKFAPTVGARKISGLIEGQARMSNFLIHMESGKTPQEAADLVNKFLFDYSDLTEFETNTIKRIVPFYTWLRKNIPLQVENMFKQPGKYDRILRGTADANQPETDEQKANRPDYLLNAIHLGNGRYIDPRLPVEDLDRFHGLKDLFGTVSPLLKVPVEETFNKNLFLDKPIANQSGDKVKAPMYLKPIATQTPKGAMIDAKLAYALKNLLPAVESTSNAVQAYVDPSANANSVDKANAFTGLNTLGARVYTVNQDQAKQNAIKDYIAKLQAAETNAKEQGYLTKTATQLKTTQDKQTNALKLLAMQQKLSDLYNQREISYAEYKAKLQAYKSKYQSKSYTPSANIKLSNVSLQK